MKIVFRADASRELGSGHVMRCLALAEELRHGGHQTFFLCRRLPGDMVKFIKSRGVAVVIVDADGYLEESIEAAQVLASIGVDWLVVDHYGLDARWELALRDGYGKIMVIDDVADRPHDCDLLLDQNLCQGMDTRYHGLVPPRTRLLLGPVYALLRPEFARARAGLRRREGALRHILVCFGGSDPGNETAKALEGIRQFGLEEITVDVVVGASNPHRDDIERLCEMEPGMVFHCQANNMAELMAKADMAIGGGGSSIWERCCLGLPSLSVILADNQIGATLAASAYGATVNLGRAEGLSGKDYRQAIEAITPSMLLYMAQRSLELVDGRGCGRVADILVKSAKNEGWTHGANQDR
jgi:UDP-2,4-diacetamido-2,4,6-trideoxy-beta-L-altropyranose hydrolase